MAKVSRSALLMYSADEMYQLVNNISAYPQFLPGCIEASILSQHDDVLHASVQVSKAGITQTFTTKNKLSEAKEIQMDLVDGPFEHLSGAWTFLALDEFACKVSLDLEFKFSSSLVELAFGKIFNNLVASMVSSFADRAKIIYGER